VELRLAIDSVTELNVIYHQRQLTEGVHTVMRPTVVSGSGAGAAAGIAGSGAGAAAGVVGSGCGAAAGLTGSGSGCGAAAGLTASGSGAAASLTGSGSAAAASVTCSGSRAGAAVTGTASAAAAAAAVMRQVDGMVEDLAKEPDPEKDKDAINPLRRRSPAAAPQLAKVKQTQPFILVFCSPWWGGVS
jgi:hypothetical protein